MPSIKKRGKSFRIMVSMGSWLSQTAFPKIWSKYEYAAGYGEW